MSIPNHLFKIFHCFAFIDFNNISKLKNNLKTNLHIWPCNVKNNCIYIKSILSGHKNKKWLCRVKNYYFCIYLLTFLFFYVMITIKLIRAVQKNTSCKCFLCYNLPLKLYLIHLFRPAPSTSCHHCHNL